MRPVKMIVNKKYDLYLLKTQNFFERLFGLMFFRKLTNLFLPGVKIVHSFFVFHSFLVIYLKRKNPITFTVLDTGVLRPFRIGKFVKGCTDVVETEIQWNSIVTVGDEVVIK
ncbi:hypothetical protein ACFL56_01795 [Candidatus Margulisiibacteriota bacterium]